MIEVESLSKSFAGIAAVQDVCFHANQGEILGILGPNGAGKTTTMRILCGYLPADSGKARVDGIDVDRDSLEARTRIGYLPENVPLYPEMRVEEYLLFRAGLKRVPRRQRAARVTESALQCGVASVLRQTIGTLSKGYRQRVGLADALVANPPVLVLDEPTTGLDPNQAADVRRLIEDLKGSRTILLCSHMLSEVEQVCDRVTIFRAGRVIASDTMAALRERLSSETTVTVEVSGGEPAAESLLEGMDLTHNLESIEDGWSRITIEAVLDPREQIFRRAMDKGLILRELTRRQLSLEQIFHELTLGEQEVDQPPSIGESSSIEKTQPGEGY